MHRTRISPIALLPLLLYCAAAVQAQNLLSNPGFENANPGDYWQLWKADTTTAATYDAVLTFPATGAHEGTRYAQVEVKAAAPENWHIQLQLPPDWVADSGASYELKFWARSDSSTSIHLGIQDGPDNNYTYRSGQDFSLSPEWTEQTLAYTSDRQGNGALRFNLYLGAHQDTYGFDSFSLEKQVVGIRGDGAGSQAFRIGQGSGNLVLSLGGGVSEDWKAELLDLRGMTLATAAGRAGRALTLAQPRDPGIYLVRAATSTRSWVRKVFLGKNSGS
ncbi:MAG: carbohydrate binding domain-containing protein [Fibrobacteres bacterium]|nr:carbohydrate binding domain-containing protein [Fibrobacterota bacterium]